MWQLITGKTQRTDKNTQRTDTDLLPSVSSMFDLICIMIIEIKPFSFYEVLSFDF